jgi:anaerobic magnesium-protoporphyrin IX monomethyl ester cyclase
LKLLNKKMEQEDILNGSRMTTEQGLLTMCHFLVNLPGETENEIRESEEMLDKLLEIHAPVVDKTSEHYLWHGNKAQ